MHFSRDLLDQPVERAARVVALELLESAGKERRRLDDPDDAEALHDFRVAVRRLRTWLRALDSCLGASTPQKAKRLLKKAAHLTGKARDAEVHHEWLEEQRERLVGSQRHAHARLMEQISEEKSESYDHVASKGAPAFDRAQAALSRKLRSYRVDVDDGEHDIPRSLAAEMAERIGAQGSELSQCLAHIRSFEDNKQGHQARIAGKRLRYLVEVVADCVSGGEQLVADLGEMQDVLGDWHDADVFSATLASRDDEQSTSGGHDAGPGLRALRDRLRKRGRKAFATVQRRWCDPRAFAPRVEAIVEELSSRGGQAREIEHKYLLARLPELPNDAPMVEIEQGYIPGKRVEERLRCVQMAGGERRYLRTLKSGHGLSRIEVEEAVPKTLFNRMWPLTQGRRLKKRRYSIAADGHTWEVDEFLDRDLVLAEVELESAEEKVELPAWLAPVVVRDVTRESVYSNASLASADHASPGRRSTRRRRRPA